VRRTLRNGHGLGTTMQLMEFGGLALAVGLGGGPMGAAFGYLAGPTGGLFLMRLGLYRATPGYASAGVLRPK